MRIERRAAPSRRLQLAAPLLAIAFTLLVSSLLVAWAGAPVGKAYALLLEGGFGSTFAWSETLTRATPLILTGLSAAVAFRARLFNIGAEGQLYAGALAAVAIGGLHGGEGFALHPWLLFPAMMAAAALAGALLLLGPALLKSRLGVDEVVTTLLLNFIVLLFVSMMLDGPMKDPTRHGLAAERGAAGRAAAGQADRAHARAHRAAVGRGAGRGAVGADEVRHAGLRRSAPSVPMPAPPPLPACRWAGSRSRWRCCRARWPGWPAPSRWPGAPAMSRWTCRRATATAASSSPCWRR